MTKKPIPILYLPWWDTYNHCAACDQTLEFRSNYQKWCSYCKIICIGCRYCLTTNIIFGITDQSQCKKCERVSLIAIDIKNIEKEFLISARMNIDNNNQIVNYMNNNSNPLEIYSFIKNLNYLPLRPLIDWISYSQITNLENDKSSFNLITPIIFIPFNNNVNECYYCKKFYSVTPLFKQKYCEYCLFLYIKYTASNNLDAYISTKNTQCNRHEPRNLNFCTQNIQEWCNSCSEISHFKQIVTNHRIDIIINHNEQQKIIEIGKYCKLCFIDCFHRRLLEPGQRNIARRVCLKIGTWKTI